LRPGLLADVEIIAAKLPNAVHIPTQALFEKDGRLVAYVQRGAGFEEVAVTPLKRSESVMAIAQGLQPGEVVALTDPTKKKDSNEKKSAKTGGK
jgi:HlyD family secretion protein